MRAALAIAVALTLSAACSAPGRQDVTVGGTRFAVSSSGPEARAVRLTPEARPDRRRTVLKGLLAIEAATGCGIRPGHWSGDTAIVRAELDCAEPPPRAAGLLCSVTAEWPIPALGTTVEEIDCVGTGG